MNLRTRHHFFARAGVQPDKWTFNALLGCCSRAGDMDGAHEVWTQMKQSGVPPDTFTVVRCARGRLMCSLLLVKVILHIALLSPQHVCGCLC